MTVVEMVAFVIGLAVGVAPSCVLFYKYLQVKELNSIQAEAISSLIERINKTENRTNEVTSKKKSRRTMWD